jgi:hypothetical protein
LGQLASGGLFLASFIPAMQEVAIPLRVLGASLGGAMVATEIPDLLLLEKAAHAGRGGAGQLTGQSPEQAKFNRVMAFANVGLAGLDVGLEVGAVQKLAGVTGKLATTGVQVTRQQWSQAMVWAKQGPAGVEKAKAFLASIKGLPQAVANEILDVIAPMEMAGVGRIPRRDLEPNQPMRMDGNSNSIPKAQKINVPQEIKINDSITWKSGEPLANFQEAGIDPAKFNRYSMDPSNANNKGKWKGFEKLGYDLKTDTARAQSAQDVINQLEQKLVKTPASFQRETEHGSRFSVEVEIHGPNGKTGTLVTTWQFDKGSKAPRLITNWLKVHGEK